MISPTKLDDVDTKKNNKLLTKSKLDKIAQRYVVSDIAHAAFSSSRFMSLNQCSLLGHSLTVVHQISSTQTLAKQLAGCGAPCGAIVIADKQTNGLGRNKRSWESENIGNLYASLILRPKSLSEAVKMNLGTGIAITRVVRAFGARTAGVKWPNDVWVDEKKLSGVLVDCDTDFIIIGIGVNIDSDMSLSANSSIARSATSLLTCTGQSIDRETFLVSLCVELEAVMMMSNDAIVEQYHALDLLVGKEIVVMPKRVENTDTYFSAIANGIADDGRLRVLRNEEIMLLSAEEVSIRPHLEYRTV